MKPVRYNIGDKVVITPACIERMKSSNRSCVHPLSPSDDYINKAMDCAVIVGEVTHVFPPSYEVTAQFPVGEGAQAFHMKDCWIERAPSRLIPVPYGYKVSVRIRREGNTAYVEVHSPMYKNVQWEMPHCYSAASFTDLEILRDRDFVRVMLDHFPVDG